MIRLKVHTTASRFRREISHSVRKWGIENCGIEEVSHVPRGNRILSQNVSSFVRFIFVLSSDLCSVVSVFATNIFATTRYKPIRPFLPQALKDAKEKVFTQRVFGSERIVLSSARASKKTCSNTKTSTVSFLPNQFFCSRLVRLCMF